MVAAYLEPYTDVYNSAFDNRSNGCMNNFHQAGALQVFSAIGLAPGCVSGNPFGAIGTTAPYEFY